MKIIRPAIQFYNTIDYNTMKKMIEFAGRTCYKSEDKINENSCDNFIKNIIKKNHKSVLEHIMINIKFFCDRGVSHELVRHRLASYSQESTRYCNYSSDKFDNEITFIKPLFFGLDPIKTEIWTNSMKNSEESYFKLLQNDTSPQDARSVLPNSLKTEINMSANIRQWHTVFEQRINLAAHPQMIQIMITTLSEFIRRFPIFFEDYKDILNKAIDYFNYNNYEIADLYEDVSFE